MSDFDVPLQELLSVSRNPTLSRMSEVELMELAPHLHERHVGNLKDAERSGQFQSASSTNFSPANCCPG